MYPKNKNVFLSWNVGKTVFCSLFLFSWFKNILCAKKSVLFFHYFWNLKKKSFSLFMKNHKKTQTKKLHFFVFSQHFLSSLFLCSLFTSLFDFLSFFFSFFISPSHVCFFFFSIAVFCVSSFCLTSLFFSLFCSWSFFFSYFFFTFFFLHHLRTFFARKKIKNFCGQFF